MYFPDRGCVRPLRHLYGYATAYCCRCLDVPSSACVCVCVCVCLCLCVCVSVCLLLTTVSPEKTDEPIEMQFGMWPFVGPGNYVLYGGWVHIHHGKWQFC